jgi:hypothetical protein
VGSVTQEAFDAEPLGYRHLRDNGYGVDQVEGLFTPTAGIEDEVGPVVYAPSGAKGLWLTVLKDAIRLAVRPGARLPQREARSWLESNRGTLGACRWVCDMLGLDVAALRQKIATLTPLDVSFHLLHGGKKARKPVALCQLHESHKKRWVA